jgi:hypothetical protein
MFKRGQKVVLKADAEEGWNEESGIIIEVEKGGMLIVKVEAQDEDDDGIREVSKDQIK